MSQKNTDAIKFKVMSPMWQHLEAVHTPWYRRAHVRLEMSTFHDLRWYAQQTTISAVHQPSIDQSHSDCMPEPVHVPSPWRQLKPVLGNECIKQVYPSYTVVVPGNYSWAVNFTVRSASFFGAGCHVTCASLPALVDRRRFLCNMSLSLTNSVFNQDRYRSQVPNTSRVSNLSLIHIWRCRRIERCRSRWSPYH